MAPLHHSPCGPSATQKVGLQQDGEAKSTVDSAHASLFLYPPGPCWSMQSHDACRPAAHHPQLLHPAVYCTVPHAPLGIAEGAPAPALLAPPLLAAVAAVLDKLQQLGVAAHGGMGEVGWGYVIVHCAGEEEKLQQLGIAACCVGREGGRRDM